MEKRKRPPARGAQKSAAELLRELRLKENEPIDFVTTPTAPPPSEAADTPEPQAAQPASETSIPLPAARQSTHIAAGTTVEAGLPNITGSFVADVKKGEHKVSGAFTAGNVIASTGEYNSFSDVYKFSLDASKSNAIYGRSATVQPAAYYVHIWRRVA